MEEKKESFNWLAFGIMGGITMAVGLMDNPIDASNIFKCLAYGVVVGWIWGAIILPTKEE